MITVKTLKILKAIKQREEGEIAIVEDEEKVYQCKDGKWVEYKNDEGLKLSLYDVNKQAIAQLPELNETQLAESTNKIASLLNDAPGQFYMMLCKDANYYTVFHRVQNTHNLLENEFIECLKDLGPIKSIEYDNFAVEAWVMYKDEPVVVYLFNYDGGIIECL